jgi:hypothetical protein
MSSISIVMTSSSRPQLFPYCWESVKRMLFFREQPRVIVHEDFVFEDKSLEVMKYLSKLEAEGEVHEIHFHNPSIGLGYTLDFLIRDIIKTDYILYLQEDWEFERPIDIDQMVYVMDQNPNVNLIFFNKSVNYETLNKADQPQYNFSGVDMCLYHSWTFLPGIWRMSKVTEKWRARKERPEGYFTNAFGTHEERMSVDFCEKNIGAYMLGHRGDYRYARHIGNDWRMAEWRLENGQPGGCHDASRMDLPHIAPWIAFKDRPVRKTYTTAEVEKQMLEEPPEINENSNCT